MKEKTKFIYKCPRCKKELEMEDAGLMLRFANGKLKKSITGICGASGDYDVRMKLISNHE